MKQAPTICTVPVTATYHVENGEAVMVSAEYADVPADVIARLLMRGFGVAIKQEETAL